MLDFLGNQAPQDAKRESPEPERPVAVAQQHGNSWRFDATRAALSRLGLPPGDDYSLPTSTRRFPDGAQFRMEVPTVNSLRTAEALLNRSIQLGTFINRITETSGIFRYSSKDIRDWVSLCAGYGCDLVMSPGPRATYDTGASVRTTDGVRMGYRLRGAEQLVYAIEDVKRAYELGVRSFIAYDEGFLWLVGEMRRQGDLPSNLQVKVSAHCGHCNPASFRLLEQLGASSINPVRDLQLPMLAALRATTSVPIDCHTDNPPSSGGFMRLYESAEFVRILAPVHLKSGNSVVAVHGQVTGADEGARMAEHVAIVVETLLRHYPSATQSPRSIATSFEPQ